jgi:hypothetical protein
MRWRNTFAAFTWCLVLGVAPLAAPQAPDQKPPVDAPKLSEAQLLKGEVYRLTVENRALRTRLAEAELRALGAPGAALEAEFLATLKAPAGSTWDWSRMVPVPPPPQPVAPASSSSTKPATP